MKTVKGVYENGEIKLLEKTSITGSRKVFVTFIDEEEENEETTIRDISLQYSSHMLKDYIKDEREDLYQDFLK